MSDQQLAFILNAHRLREHFLVHIVHDLRCVCTCSTVALDGTKDMSLDDCLEYVIDDELVEVTPASVRMRKNPDMNKKGKKN